MQKAESSHYTGSGKEIIGRDAMIYLIEESLALVALAAIFVGACCVLYVPYRLSYEAWRWAKESLRELVETPQFSILSR
jgi:hypothetical protein